MDSAALLFVDDEENVLKSLLRMFQEEDYEIVAAHNGYEGLKYVKHNDFNVVISDYRMPQMNGIEFLKRVKKISPDSVRIIFTGNADVDVALAAINEGHVYKFLMKPWEEELLKMEIKNSLEYYSLIRQKKALFKEVEQKNKMLANMNDNLEKLVEERTQQLLHSEKMAVLGQIAAQIGHEINNILTVLIGRMQLLKKKSTQAKSLNGFIMTFDQELNRLAIQVKNLLTLGKPVNSKFENLDISIALDTTINKLMCAGVLKYYGIKKQYPDSLPLIHGDSSQIEQVFTNLLINAHHAMGETGNLNVGINILAEKRFIETFIKDSGEGIAEENFEKIFEPFFTTKPQGKGTGLGLPVVKKIMEKHNGYVKIDSNVKGGTTMTLGFPLINHL